MVPAEPLSSSEYRMGTTRLEVDSVACMELHALVNEIFDYLSQPIETKVKR
jgi:hypothetical protein